MLEGLLKLALVVERIQAKKNFLNEIIFVKLVGTKHRSDHAAAEVIQQRGIAALGLRDKENACDSATRRGLIAISV